MKQMGILVSVIVPVYNVEKYLHRCIDSILKQTYNELEIILVDDGSTDSSGTICDQYKEIDERIIVVHQKNGGLSCARNTGISIASGEYIGFVDSDDWVHKSMIESLVCSAIKCRADLAICKMASVINEKIQFTDTTNEEIAMSKDEALTYHVLQDDKVKISVASCCKLYKRELIKSYMFPLGKQYEDTLHALQILMDSKNVVFIDSELYYYVRDRVGSITQMANIEKMFADRFPQIEARINLLIEVGRNDLAKVEKFYYMCILVSYYMDLYKIRKKVDEKYLLYIINYIQEQKDFWTILLCKRNWANQHYIVSFLVKLILMRLSPELLVGLFEGYYKIKDSIKFR